MGRFKPPREDRQTDGKLLPVVDPARSWGNLSCFGVRHRRAQALYVNDAKIE